MLEKVFKKVQISKKLLLHSDQGWQYEKNTILLNT